ncbi:MAG TPA: Hsp20/alpha crystallin family protein [Geobacteraceae bacterium]
MRKQTELRTVTNRENSRRAGEKTNVVDVKREGEGLTTSLSPTVTLENNLRSTINEMERWFEESFHRPFLGLNWLPVRNLFNDIGITGDITPAIDIFEEGKSLVVKAELPGIRKEDVNVRLVDNNLIISGEKRTEEKVERNNYLRLERTHGAFSRTLNMPEGIDYEAAKATFRDGVLEIRIPRTGDAGTVRQITID